MTRRVVFAGGIQAKALAKAYRLDVALDRDEDVFFINVEAIAREAAQRVVAAADVLITDLTTDGQTVPDSLIRVGTLKIAVPVVDGSFLWPFAEKPHPRNAPSEGLPDGPYPAGFGDSYLDNLVAQGVEEDEAVSRYLALDIGQEAGLDDRLRTCLATQARLDASSGFDLAAFIAENFRTQTLFTTRDHLALPLFKHVGWRLFRQMGIASDRILGMFDTYFPPDAMPIHPGVLRHFGMAAPPADHRYPLIDEGSFTFEQFCRRYVRFEWNKLLHSAIAMVDSNPSEAIPALRLALETSPDSVAGLRALEEAERAVSDSSMLAPLALPAPAKPASEPPPTATVEAPQPVVALPDLAPADPDPDLGPAPEAPAAFAEEPAAPESPPLRSLRRLPAAPARYVSDLDEPDADDGALPEAGKPKAVDPNHAVLPSFGFGHGPLQPLSSFAAGSRGDDTAGAPLVLFSPPARPSTPPAEIEEDLEAVVPEQQSYIELPLTPFGPLEPQAAAMPMTRTNRYTPLAPAEHLIKVLPRMLPNTRGMAGSVDRPFDAMPETMPPPPLRPVLPPELHPEPTKSGLVSKLISVLRK